MGLKRKIWLSLIHFSTYLAKRKKLANIEHFNCDLPDKTIGDQIDIVTIAFNNEKLIEKQIRSIKKYVLDKHLSFFVADNSTIPEKRELIKALCHKYQVGYLSVPDNIVAKFIGGSYSHGTTINWIFYNFIKIRKPFLFGFIDHDLFPINAVMIKEKVGERDFYGDLVDHKAGWYLWAGFCFFKFNAVKNIKLDFIPYIEKGTYLDTGGANYPVLYRNYDKEKLNLPTRVNVSINEGTNYYTSYIQYIENTWLHMINGSNWKSISDEAHKRKEKTINKKLEF